MPNGVKLTHELRNAYFDQRYPARQGGARVSTKWAFEALSPEPMAVSQPDA